MDSIELIANIITIIGLPLAAIGLCFTYKTIEQSKKIEEAKFWLQLRTDFFRYNYIHEKLLTNNKWNSNDDIVGLYGYLGQFELCNSMLEAGIVSLSTFKSQYKYRLEILLENESVKDRLIDENEHWKDFKKLLEKIELPYPK